MTLAGTVSTSVSIIALLISLATAYFQFGSWKAFSVVSTPSSPELKFDQGKLTATMDGTIWFINNGTGPVSVTKLSMLIANKQRSSPDGAIEPANDIAFGSCRSSGGAPRLFNAAGRAD
jgi:hypothetical protein